MKAEERARRILDIVATWDNISKFESAIAEEIRQAQSEAFELAAKKAESFVDPEWPNDDMSQQAKDIADAIRKLGGEG